MSATTELASPMPAPESHVVAAVPRSGISTAAFGSAGRPDCGGYMTRRSSSRGGQAEPTSAFRAHHAVGERAVTPCPTRIL